mmetsp:Transcript_11950/g.29248  ORF Transcript_11950/g.29248 Transcript_11950/m.29248 type:complete len:297 (+) Transcript_11950:1735-2625(+)
MVRVHPPLEDDRLAALHKHQLPLLVPVQRLDKPGVVADEDDAPLESAKGLRKGLDALYVKVVGRLVEHEHMRGLNAHAREGNACLLPPREILDADQVRVPFETVPAQLLPAVLNLLHRAVVMLDRQPLQVCAGALVQRQLVHKMLIVSADTKARVAAHFALCGLQVARHQIQERTLPAAVGANDGDPRVHPHTEIDALKDLGPVLVRKGHVLHSQHRRPELRRVREGELDFVLSRAPQEPLVVRLDVLNVLLLAPVLPRVLARQGGVRFLGRLARSLEALQGLLLLVPCLLVLSNL